MPVAPERRERVRGAQNRSRDCPESPQASVESPQASVETEQTQSPYCHQERETEGCSREPVSVWLGGDHPRIGRTTSQQQMSSRAHTGQK